MSVIIRSVYGGLFVLEEIAEAVHLTHQAIDIATKELQILENFPKSNKRIGEIGNLSS